MKFYIATGIDQIETAKALRELVLILGHKLTYDWTIHGSVERESEDRKRQVALAETRGVIDADFMIVALPGGRGTHIELGLALGRSLPVCMLAPLDSDLLIDGRGCIFYHHPLVTRVRSADEVLAWISVVSKKKQ